MKTKRKIFLTHAARDTGVPEDELHSAALALAEPNTNCSEEIWFLPFRVRGRQFALCTRLVLEIDYLPNRVPNILLLNPTKAADGFKRPK